jgi:lysophospholipase L1-like esterase
MDVKTTFYTSAKVFLIGIVCLLVLEVCARLDDWFKWDAPLLGAYSRESLTLLDSKGLRNRPNSQYEKWRINNFGFRGDDIQKELSEGIVRVMVLGASETFGLYEEPGKEFPAQLQELLNRQKSKHFEVINAAVPGLSPPRILQLYDSWLSEFKPHIVIYYPSLSGYLMHNPPAAVHSRGDTVSQPQAIEPRIKNKASTAIKRFLPEAWQTTIKMVLIEQAVAEHPPEWVFHVPPPDRAELLERQLAELVERIRQSGSLIILATHATAVSNPISEDERRMLIGWRKLYPHVAESAFIEMERIGNQIIRQLAGKEALPLVDFDARLPKTRENFADHVHFTTVGAGIVAEILAEIIVKLCKTPVRD